MNNAIYTDIQGLASLKAGGSENRIEAIKKVGHEFESMFIKQLFKNMRDTNRIFNQDNPMSSSEVEFHQDMLDQQLSLSIASGSSFGKGLGIADAFIRQLSSQYDIDDKKTSVDNDSRHISRIREMALPVIKSIQKENSIELKNGANIEAVSAEINAGGTSFSSPQDFINQLYSMAKGAAKKLGTNAEILLSQAALETGWGQHIMQANNGESSHNLFGIKSQGSWQGKTIDKASLEYEQGSIKKVVSGFRQYDSFKDSFMDYVDFLKSSPRYDKAIAAAGDPKEYVEALQQAGYATDPEYANKIIAIFSKLSR